MCSVHWPAGTHSPFLEKPVRTIPCTVKRGVSVCLRIITPLTTLMHAFFMPFFMPLSVPLSAPSSPDLSVLRFPSPLPVLSIGFPFLLSPLSFWFVLFSRSRLFSWSLLSLSSPVSPGTGKSLSAEAMAYELGRPLRVAACAELLTRSQPALISQSAYRAQGRNKPVSIFQEGATGQVVLLLQVRGRGEGREERKVVG